MFKRVLLCYDGTEVGRRALLRGAELAILLRAQVFVLSIIPRGVGDPIIAAGAVGSASFTDEPGEYQKLLEGSLRWLRDRGVTCEGFLASGNVIDEIAAFGKRHRIDLIVLGYYPQPSGGFWWSSGQRGTLAERTNCCIFLAVNATSTTDPSPQSA